MDKIHKQIDYLKKTLKQWEHEYYVQNKPSVSDEEYDLKLRELIELEKKYPQYVSEDSPTKRVGGQISTSFEKIKHHSPMLSLSNAFSEEEILKFDIDIKKIIKAKQIEYSVEPKIDGLSISLIYINGKLKNAITRGDGEYGENIFNNAITIKSIPLSIDIDLEWFEVRGEVFMSYKQFNTLNKSFDNEEDKFANPRNAAAGSLKNLDSSEVAKRGLEMIAYYIPDEATLSKLHIEKQTQVIDQLKKLKFKVALENKKCNNINEVISYIEKLNKIRKTLNYPIDGIVIKVNEIKYYQDISLTSKFPKWAIAYKFPPEIKTTKLINIEPTIGRSGRVTYVAKLEPVEISGSIVSNATLHNADYIINNDIRINDDVKVFKAGEIIPKVIGPVIDKRKGNEKPFHPITICPVCGSKLFKLEQEVDQYCLNVSCPARTLQSLVFFCSKQAMNIEDLSEKNLNKFYQAGYIKKISDIYNLINYKERILESDFKIKQKAFNNIWNNIQNSKNNSLERLLIGLGIKHVGEVTAKVLAKKYESLDNIIKTTYEELKQINDIGPIVAESIIDFFKNEQNINLIKQLKANGINMSFKSSLNQDLIDKTSKYYKKNFVITGKFNIDRNQIKQKLIAKYDVNFSESVTKNTNFVIVGENPGSKYDKAIKLGIKIIRDVIW